MSWESTVVPATGASENFSISTARPISIGAEQDTQCYFGTLSSYAREAS